MNTTPKLVLIERKAKKYLYDQYIVIIEGHPIYETRTTTPNKHYG